MRQAPDIRWACVVGIQNQEASELGTRRSLSTWHHSPRLGSISGSGLVPPATLDDGRDMVWMHAGGGGGPEQVIFPRPPMPSGQEHGGALIGPGSEQAPPPATEV